MALPDEFPYRDQCPDCAQERLHHHTGEHTQGTVHEAGNCVCWCLAQQDPSEWLQSVSTRAGPTITVILTREPDP